MESFCTTLLALTTLLICSLCEGKGIVAPKAAGRFWMKNCEKLEEFCTIQNFFDFFSPSSAYHRTFRQIAIKSKVAAAITLLCGIITANAKFAMNMTPTGVQRHRKPGAEGSNSTTWSHTVIANTLQLTSMVPYLFVALTA